MKPSVMAISTQSYLFNSEFSLPPMFQPAPVAPPQSAHVPPPSLAPQPAQMVVGNKNEGNGEDDDDDEDLDISR